MNDIITIGEAMIVFDPSATGPLRFVNSFDKKVGGAELNFAIGCTRLGLKSGWISRLGKDEFGTHIRNFARGEGVDVSQVDFVEGYPTSLNFKEIMEDGSVRTFYYRDKSPTLTLTPEDLDESYFKNAKVLHLTGIYPAIDPVNRRVFEKAISLAKKHGVKVSFDPNIRLKLWSKEEARDYLSEILPHVDILLAGDEEMEIIWGVKDPEAIIRKAKEIGITYVAIKQGDKGSVGYYNDEVIKVEAKKARKVVDTVGAGDGFNAGFMYGVLNGWDLKKSLEFGNTVGAMVVSVKGDNEGLPYLEDVKIFLGEKENIER
ncbi:sugar kinase [Ornithinibacillus halotolerans]|uniref:2-dehydro-3-deoxygluconokinase n=1 Tax=Ornithinibacillus halotolerans TaxID=1274357 RepID=A0A916SAC2_9BACI|nr:sugar kinase [Ornithinibacillus halotolerans]GGA90958.1 2-dehydro-3-deoxygluconokinase [Ornithinibacillus halotolerans]